MQGHRSQHALDAPFLKIIEIALSATGGGTRVRVSSIEVLFPATATNIDKLIFRNRNPLRARHSSKSIDRDAAHAPLLGAGYMQQLSN